MLVANEASAHDPDTSQTNVQPPQADKEKGPLWSAMLFRDGFNMKSIDMLANPVAVLSLPLPGEMEELFTGPRTRNGSKKGRCTNTLDTH